MARPGDTPTTAGISTSENAIIQLIGMIVLHQNDEWTVQVARYMTLEFNPRLSDNATVELLSATV